MAEVLVFFKKSGGNLRLRIKLQPEKEEFTLTCHYNGYIQAFIYRHLDEWLAKEIHDRGFKDPLTERRIKLFTFSRLLSKEVKIKDRTITFRGPVNLIISSPHNEFIQSFASNLIRRGMVYLSEQPLHLQSVEVEALPPYRERVIVRTLSPVTVYSTLQTPEGRKKTYYYSPFEKDFEELVLENLRRKLRTWSGMDIDGGSVRPYRVNSRNERIIIYKDTVIKAWDGLYELRLPEELFMIAYESGLGAKNSQGFGCIEVWEGREKDIKEEEDE